YQITWHTNGNLWSQYTAGWPKPFGSPDSYIFTWENPGVVIDGLGNFTFLGQESDGMGDVYNFNPKWPQDMGAYFVYHSQAQGTVNYGSYNQISGHSSWVQKNWELIFTGQVHLAFWYAPATLTKNFGGNDPPLNHGVFTLPFGSGPLTIHEW
ncbi:MAG TPA: hypothetical protein VKT78_07960, partial [Fimbriimonadaceae bacterium]|nr:hypothetical protein [Fimbriimonadaceae bacterium]